MTGRTYYHNLASKEVRIVQTITNDSFAVVKIVNDRTCTVKFWRGSIENTERHWRTRPFEPSSKEKFRLDLEFDLVIS